MPLTTRLKSDDRLALKSYWQRVNSIQPFGLRQCARRVELGHSGFRAGHVLTIVKGISSTIAVVGYKIKIRITFCDHRLPELVCDVLSLRVFFCHLMDCSR